MTNEKKKINELVSDDDPTYELEASTFRQNTGNRSDSFESADGTYDMDEHAARAKLESKTLSKLHYDFEQLRAKWVGVTTELKAREEITRQLNSELSVVKDALARSESLLAERDRKIETLEVEILHGDKRDPDVETGLESNAPVEQARQTRTEEYADLLRRKLQDRLAQHNETLKDKDQLSRMLDLADETRQKLESEISLLGEERDRLMARLETIEAKHAEEIRMLRFELGEAQDTVAQTEALNSQLTSDLVDTRGFKQQLERMLTDSDAQSQQRIEELEDELASVSGVLNDLEEKLEDRGNTINLLLAELARNSSQPYSIDDFGRLVCGIDHRIAEQFEEEEESGPRSARSGDRVTRVLLGKVGEKLLRFPLFKDRLTIGRTSDNDIQLNAPFVSRRHAVVTTDGQKTRVIDWGSRNGVLVNSSPVTEHFLKSGDIVTIGNAHFRYDERPKREG
jgi:predicted  nucleic acid-binding Zn-ribbon protein